MHLETQGWSLCKRKINEGKCYWNQSTTHGRRNDLQLHGAGSRLRISTTLLSVCSESTSAARLFDAYLSITYAWISPLSFPTLIKLLFLFYDVAFMKNIHGFWDHHINKKWYLFQTAGSTSVPAVCSHLKIKSSLWLWEMKFLLGWISKLYLTSKKKERKLCFE